MKSQALRNIAQYDNPGLYKALSSIRQMKDADWAIELLPERKYGRSLDIGCGIGDFLGKLGMTGMVSEQMVGIDRSADMVRAARKKLRPMSRTLNLSLRQANVLNSPSLEGRFDLVTMMAVQHWLYPDEAGVFSWIAGLLHRYGVFCLTTYHPTVSERFVGGSDEVVLDAMEQIGEPAWFPAGFVPMGRRTRPAAELELLLQESFKVYEVHVRPAVTRATSAKQYADFHLATFGSYYSQLLPARLRTRFLEAIGRAAMRRMRTLGYVTSMQVRFWVCGEGRTAGSVDGWRSSHLSKTA